MPPKPKGKEGGKKKASKDAPVKLDDKDLLSRADIKVACLENLLEFKSQEVCALALQLRSQAICKPRGKLRTAQKVSDSSSSGLGCQAT